MMDRIYLDHAATTYVDEEVFEAIKPFYTQCFGNPSSQHVFGREALKAVDDSREKIAACLGAKPSEIYFTAGGSESDNWAIKGIAFANSDKGRHIVTSAIEHPAVLNSCKYLEKNGFEVTYLSVDKFGFVSVDDLKKAIRQDTVLVSIMAANNEIGTIEPVKELAAACKENGVLFHTDAVQAIGAMEFDVEKDGIDLLSLSAHKFYAPKGVGVLYIRNGVKIDKYISGGEQERGRRAGTLNTPAIIGMGIALDKLCKNAKDTNERMTFLRDKLIQRIANEIPFVKLNGPAGKKRLPSNVSFSFKDAEGSGLLLLLDMQGVAVSAGSACSSHSLTASHVIQSIGLEPDYAMGTLRFSLGKSTSEEEIDKVVELLKPIVEKLRNK